jgi:hypothetical protein
MTGAVEGFRHRLGERLMMVADRFPSKSAAAKAAGVSTEQFNKWLAGTVKVPVEGLWRLSEAGQADFRWLCAGSSGVEAGDGVQDRIDPSQPLDADIMHDVLTAMVSATRDGDVVYASPEKFATLASALHDYVADQRRRAEEVDLSSMAQIIRLASR